MPRGERAEKKKAYFERIGQLVDAYPNVLIVLADFVGSRQMADIRSALRGKAIILMGKNTMIRTALRRRLDKNPTLEKLINCVKLNMGFVFCISDPSEVRNIIIEYKVPAPAKQGVIAPVDVFVKAGPTSMDPGCTSFFQALGISTKIVKGQIEIQTDVHLIKVKEKVSASAASLLQKLNIKPFSYGLNVHQVYDNGSVYDAAVLDLTDDDILAKFQQGVNNVAALSLRVGFPTAASIPHSILEGFKFATALILDSEFTFSQMENIKRMVENPEAFSSVSAPAPTSSSNKEQAPAEAEESEEEEEDLGFTLFD